MLTNDDLYAMTPGKMKAPLDLSVLDSVELNTMLTRVGRLWCTGRELYQREVGGRSVSIKTPSLTLRFRFYGNELYIIASNASDHEKSWKVIADDEALWDGYTSGMDSYLEADLENEVVEFFEDYL